MGSCGRGCSGWGAGIRRRLTTGNPAAAAGLSRASLGMLRRVLRTADNPREVFGLRFRTRSGWDRYYLAGLQCEPSNSGPGL